MSTWRTPIYPLKTQCRHISLEDFPNCPSTQQVQGNMPGPSHCLLCCVAPSALTQFIQPSLSLLCYLLEPISTFTPNPVADSCQFGLNPTEFVTSQRVHDCRCYSTRAMLCGLGHAPSFSGLQFPHLYMRKLPGFIAVLSFYNCLTLPRYEQRAQLPADHLPLWSAVPMRIRNCLPGLGDWYSRETKECLQFKTSFFPGWAWLSG